MDLPFSKIIVDSRHADAGTSESFEVSLPETISLPQHAVCYVCDLQVTNSFTTVDSSNNNFYWLENGFIVSGTIMNKITLTSQNYEPHSLAEELQAKMNAASVLTDSNYVVSFDSNNNVLNFSRSSTADKTFFLVNDDLLRNEDFRANTVLKTFDTSNGRVPWTMNYARPASALPLIGLGPRSSQNASYADILALGDALGNAHSSAALDLRSVHTVYLHCPTLTNYKVLGPAGSRSIIARVAVDGLPGSILTHHHSGHVLDYIPCGGVTLQTLKFDVRNAQNEQINMRGGHISFSIMFSAAPLA